MYDLPEWLYEYLIQLPKASIINIMEGALDNMQQYNGSSMTSCVVMAIEGAEHIELNDGDYSYTLPKIKRGARAAIARAQS